MDLVTLRGRVYSELSEEQNRYFKDEDIDYWLNVGQREMANQVKHLKDTASTTTNSDKQEYPLPDDYLDHYKVMYGDTRLNEIPDNVESTEEYGYYLWSENINLNFFPDGSELTIYYYRTPQEMQNDVDKPEVSIEYQDGLIQFALMKAKQKDEKYNQAQIHQQNYRQTLNKMMKRYSKEPMERKWKVKRL